LALAVGILVDDATVTIENINYHLEQGKEVEQAILDGAHQIALPALVSTLAICIVFVPMFLLAGIAKFLFIPLAEAVVFAMLASYLLSRTLVPTLAKFWLKKHETRKTAARSFLTRFQESFERRFARFRDHYKSVLNVALGVRPHVRIFCFLPRWRQSALLAFPIGPLPGLGQDFFPSVDGGQINFTCARGQVLASKKRQPSAISSRAPFVRDTCKQLASVVDNIGLPYSGINLAYSTSAPVGPW